MKRNGLRFALLGLLFGVLLGGAIVYVRGIAVRELNSLLEEEFLNSTGCRFEADSVAIHLLPLRAVARNARVACSDGEKLRFQRIVAFIGLQEIFKRRLLLSELRLVNGVARGVGENSVLYRFIDTVTTAPPPELDGPKRWKLKLMRVTLKDSTLIEEFSNQVLIGEQASLDCRRNAEDNFDLNPTIKVLRLHSKKGDTPDMIFGQVSGSLTIFDERVEFHRLRLERIPTVASLSGISLSKQGNAFSGEATMQVDPATLGLERYATTQFSGRAIIGGTLGNPNLHGEFSSGTFAIPALSFLFPKPFAESRGAFSFDLNHRDWRLFVDPFNARNDTTELSNMTPIAVSDPAVHGELKLLIASLELGGFDFNGVDLVVQLKGSFDEPAFDAHGKIAAADLGFLKAVNVDFKASQQGREVLLNAAATQPNGGNLTFEGAVDIDSPEPLRISRPFLVQLHEFDPVADDAPGQLALSGAVQLEGALDTKALSAKGDLALHFSRLAPDLELAGPLHLTNGDLLVSLQEPAAILALKLEADIVDRRASLSGTIRDLRPAQHGATIDCVELAADLRYDFSFAEPFKGQGLLTPQSLSFGCGQSDVRLENTNPWKISEGAVDLRDIRFQGLETAFQVGGSVSLTKGYNLNATGSLDLHSLLSLTHGLDDLRGTVDTKVALAGALGSPIFSGNAVLHDGELSKESVDLDISGVRGDLVITDNRIGLNNLTGSFNGGVFTLGGVIDPFNLAASVIQITAQDVLVQPISDATLVLSGNLELTKLDSGAPGIRGAIAVENAEFRRNLNLRTIIQSLPEYLFARAAARGNLETLPPLDLDVDVNAPRNIFVYTNFLGAELRTQLNISGNLSAPIVRGRMETLAGWFGIKDRKFEITSGVITFRPGSVEPVLELVSEGTVQSRTGETLFVILEANGPLTNPTITLSSDRGLSQREILSLITSGGNLSDQTQINTLDRLRDFEDEPLFDRDNGFDLGRFLRSLAQIDTLALEPTYNYLSGAIEPALIARKRIFKNLYLEGESFFASTSNQAKAQAVLNLSPKVNVSVSAETSGVENETAFEIGIVRTILAARKSFLTASYRGNKKFDEDEISRAVGINDSTRVPHEELAKLSAAIERFYRARGYFAVHVEAACLHEGESFCHRIEFTVDERPQSKVSAIELSGESPEPMISLEAVEKKALGEPASERTLRNIESLILNRLRGEGFISARVSGGFRDAPATAPTPTSRQGQMPSGSAGPMIAVDKVLAIEIRVGKPVSFSFQGNNRFSAEDFLNTINLFKRKLPFGNNTINILVENMERLYRQAGYLYATISYTREEDQQTGRVNYLITVIEETPTSVSAVRLEDNEKVSDTRLRELITERAPETAPLIFRPKAAVAEEIASNSLLIAEVYHEEGFPEAQVEGRIVPDESPEQVAIIYSILEGPQQKADWLAIDGAPPGIDVTLPRPPYSIAKANRTIDILLALLSETGYRTPAVSSELDDESGVVRIHVEPGPLTLIGTITIEGNRNIEEAVIRGNLIVSSGEPWNEVQIAESRRKLLKLGLFTRIEITPSDGILDSTKENMTVTVLERPLQSLEIGFGANSTYGAHYMGEATDRSLFGDGKSISLRTDLYYDPRAANFSRGTASLSYFDPALVDSDLSLTEDLRYQKLDTVSQEYDLDRISLASYLYHDWSHGLAISFGHTILSENLSNVTPDAIIGPFDSGNVRLSFLSGILSYDRRDAPLNPREGYFLSTDYKLASRAIGSDADFYGLGARGSFLHPFGGPLSRWSLAAATHVASTWTFGDTPEVPISQRYYLGGRSTIRGFRENSLGPRGAEGAVIGGDMLFANNFELRYLVADNTSLHTFLDAGSVFLRDQSPALADLRYSAGVGVQYLSPIGPIGIDIGHPLDEQAGEPSLRLHFNIGSSF